MNFLYSSLQISNGSNVVPTSMIVSAFPGMTVPMQVVQTADRAANDGSEKEVDDDEEGAEHDDEDEEEIDDDEDGVEENGPEVVQATAASVQ